jgi:toluene monooxygenase system ferredoxin subunit
MALRIVLPDEDLWVGELRGALVNDQRILLLRLEDGVRAYQDRCAHLGVPLSRGTLEGHVLTCSAHHYQYDARTGEGLNPRAVRLTPVRALVRDGNILVDVDAGESATATSDLEGGEL